MSTQVGTIGRTSGKPFGSRTIVAIVVAAILVLGVTAAMPFFRGTSEPIRQPQHVRTVSTEQTTSAVEATTSTETMLIEGGLQPRPFAELTAKQVRRLQGGDSR